MSRIIMEACCGSADDVFEAVQGGADRVELNSNLFQGGLTPSVGELVVAKRHVNVPIMTMLRPRSGGFCYTDMEYECMLEDGKELLAHGADGIVFGCLTPDGVVDIERTKRFVELAGDKDCVFHRALDVTPDWKKALETLIKCGVKRVLTSGQAPDVFFALDTIKEMIAFAGDAIQILPGAGITLQNVDKVVAYTGTRQVHLARHKAVADTSTQYNTDIYFGGALYPPETYYEVSDRAYFAGVRAKLG